MALHLIKLCVGISRVEQLEEEGRAARGLNHPPFVRTRMTPKRAAEIEDGGSLYWVIKGVVSCRQQVLEILTHGEGPNAWCEIRLDPEVVRTAPLGRKPFQGWRYLEPREAPADLSRADAQGLPEDLVRELREIGAW